MEEFGLVENPDGSVSIIVYLTLAFNIYAKGDLKASYSVKKWILLQNVF
jgi:hypothetical protein